MQWADEGIVLSTRLHGEASAIAEVMTRGHGRHLGLIRGARSARNRALLQPGNGVACTWNARLDEHLGQWTLELVTPRAGRLMEKRLALAGLTHLGVLLRLLPEREPHPGLYEAASVLLGAFDDPLAAGAMMARFEMRLLDDLGFGLDLSECAATGATDDLIYVSPKSGRAVSRLGGAPWKERLLPLPAFCVGGSAAALNDVADGLRMTGFFLGRHVAEPRGLQLEPARDAFIRAVLAAGGKELAE